MNRPTHIWLTDRYTDMNIANMRSELRKPLLGEKLKEIVHSKDVLNYPYYMDI